MVNMAGFGQGFHVEISRMDMSEFKHDKDDLLTKSAYSYQAWIEARRGTWIASRS